MNQPTNIQKLDAIYSAARAAPLNADQHEALRKWASELAEEMKPKDKTDGETEQA